MRSSDLANRFRPADAVLLVVLLALSAASFLYARELLPGANDAVIEADGRPVHVLPLDRDDRKEVAGPRGVTVVEVRDGRVRVAGSPCENHLCVGQGWVDRGVIVCLPNRVTITVRGGKQGAGRYDAVSG